MSTFDSTKRSLGDLLRDIREGKIQLPDFQRGWVWDDDHIKDLLVSISRSFPVGAIMLLENGGDVRFQMRPVEGIDPATVTKEPDQLILDGQQRLTTLTQAISLKSPVQTRTSKGKKILRHYYFDIRAAIDDPENLIDAIVSVDETKKRYTNFGRTVDLDLSTQDKECEQLYFPCEKIFEWSAWMQQLNAVNPTALSDFLKFQGSVLEAFNRYQLPVIELKKETSKEAVCLVFEKVNTGGVPLSVFELITASYAADGFNLRDDWFGSNIRNQASRQEEIGQDALLKNLEATDFLQAITLLYTRERKAQDIKAGRQGKQIRPTSAKRSAVLDLPLEAYKKWNEPVTKGFIEAAQFLRYECFFKQKEIPYRTQLIPLASVMTLLGNRWREPRIKEKLSQWYWCGVLGELYGGAVETRIANDLDELMLWFEDDSKKPRTVEDANFQPERLERLYTRLSAAYKGINVLILREGAKDFFWQMDVQELDNQGIDLDIHHIFPKAWCMQNGIDSHFYDNVINKTPISFKANRKIGGNAPSEYLEKLQNEPQVQANDQQMDQILATHLIPAETLRANDFASFYQQRQQLLMGKIYEVMGKADVEQNSDEPAFHES